MTARVVTLAGLLDGYRADRWYATEFDVDQVAAIAATLTPAEAARMGNRIRATTYAEKGIRCGDGCPPGCLVDPVPAEPLPEVWDAPPYVWEHAGTFHTVTAVTVVPRLYLETWVHPYETPRDRFGAQVVVRAATHGRPDAFAVFWRADSTGPYDGAAWQWVTRELDTDGMTTWSGLPLPLGSTGMQGGRAPVAAGLERWLSGLVTAALDD